MDALIIPKQPDSLYLVLNKTWKGEAVPSETLHTEVWVGQSQKGLVVRVHGHILPDQRIPTSTRDKRTDGLWNYDVVELFLVGENGHYLEIELGPGGHWLVLGFDGVRHRSNDYVEFNPDHRNSSAIADTWQSIITIPWDMIPQPLARLNAFAVFGGEQLALHPVPGDKPDFHQPDTFPQARIQM